MPDTQTSRPAATVIHNTNIVTSTPTSASVAAAINSGHAKVIFPHNLLKLKIETPPIASVSTNGNPSAIMPNMASATTADGQTRVIQLASQTPPATGIEAVPGATSIMANASATSRLMTTNILKRPRPNSAGITVQPTTPVAAKKGSAASVSSTTSEADEASRLMDAANSLNMLANEAARRSPTLNLTPSTTSDVPLNPRFISGPFIQGSK